MYSLNAGAKSIASCSTSGGLNECEDGEKVSDHQEGKVNGCRVHVVFFKPHEPGAFENKGNGAGAYLSPKDRIH